MRHLALAAAVMAAISCNQSSPMDPNDGSRPQFATTSTVSISGRGTALQLNNTTILTEASFTCPEGDVAAIDVSVNQPSTLTSGKGAAIENCKDGPNTVVVEVIGAGKNVSWDIARAVATWTITTKTNKDSDTKEIMIKAP
jgi:hypothetical protein